MTDHPSSDDALPDDHLATAAGGGIIAWIKDLFSGDDEEDDEGGSFGGGGAGGSW